MPCAECSSALLVLRLEKDPVPLDLSLNIVNCVLNPSAFLPQQCRHYNFKFTYFSSVYLHQQSAHCKSLRKPMIFALENPCESPFAKHCKLCKTINCESLLSTACIFASISNMLSQEYLGFVSFRKYDFAGFHKLSYKFATMVLHFESFNLLAKTLFGKT